MVALVIPGVARAQGVTGAGVRAVAAGDSAAVVGVIDRFHAALAAGDSSAALELLAPEVVILESGGLETRDEYRSHHLAADIAFARVVRTERGAISVAIEDGVAWVASTSTTSGMYRERKIDSTGAELMVLKRSAAGWKIAAIHWSSRSRR